MQEDSASGESAVWTFRGYRLRPSEFSTAMIHFYRAEVTRANSWRARLDVTSNWALVSTGAAISFAFSQQYTHHSIILLNTLLITLFLFIEARRYRYYELWSYRVRLMETDFFAAMLVPPFKPDPEWATKLTETLINPRFSISAWEAIGRRLRRNYLWIYLILGFAWIAKLVLFPAAVESWAQFVSRARLGVVPGQVTLVAALLVYGTLAVVALATRGLRQSSGEVLPRYGTTARKLTPSPAAVADPQAAATPPPPKTAPFLALVTTEQRDAICARISRDLKHTPTVLDPDNTTGAQTTLMLRLEVPEIAALKALVHEVDPQSVVIVIPADDLLKESAGLRQAAETRAP
jgi:uncharacterized membrane protein